MLQQIIGKTDGVPFVEEITKSLLESGQLKAVDGHYELAGSLSTFAIPATLQDSLMARLDRLMTEKSSPSSVPLSVASLRMFCFMRLRNSTTGRSTRNCTGWLRRELVYQRGVPPQTTYTFKHALTQDAAYASLLSTRQHYHQLHCPGT